MNDSKRKNSQTAKDHTKIDPPPRVADNRAPRARQACFDLKSRVCLHADVKTIKKTFSGFKRGSVEQV